MGEFGALHRSFPTLAIRSPPGAANQSDGRERAFISRVSSAGPAVRSSATKDTAPLPMTKLGRRSSLPPCLKTPSLATARPKPTKRATVDENDSAAAVQRAVRFAPLPTGNTASLQHQGKGGREDYVLGDKAKKLSHMLCNRGPGQAFQLVRGLRCRDFAFVRTKDGTFVYSILACRSLEPSKDANSSPEALEEWMIFVLSDAGETVKLKKEEWVENVRLVSEEFEPPCSKESDQWVPPDLISFVPDRESAKSRKRGDKI